MQQCCSRVNKSTATFNCKYTFVTHAKSIYFLLTLLFTQSTDTHDPLTFALCFCRQLSNSPRIRLHKHLFASLFIYAVLSSLLKLNLLMKRSDDAYITSNDEEESAKNTSSLDVYCLILSLSLRYFRSTTYLCMFNEAYYLYQLIKKVFDAPSVTPLIVIAYALPFLITSTYVAARALLPSTPVDLSSSSVTLHLPTIDASGGTIHQAPSLPPSLLNSSRPVFVNGHKRLPPSEQDACWMLPARDSWKEWIINGPNLAMLLVSGPTQHCTFHQNNHTLQREQTLSLSH